MEQICYIINIVLLVFVCYTEFKSFYPISMYLFYRDVDKRIKVENEVITACTEIEKRLLEMEEKIISGRKEV
jgi:hypothetical protein